jgi:hypothetical protein
VIVLLLIIVSCVGNVLTYSIYVSCNHMVSNWRGTFSSAIVNISFYFENAMHMLREFTEVVVGGYRSVYACYFCSLCH